MKRADVEIVDVPMSERTSLLPILEESFEGIYLWHSKRILQSIETVRAARIAGEAVGLIMLKIIGGGQGYVYYVAVSPTFRRRGIASALVDDAVSFLAGKGAEELFASVPGDNVESSALFSSRGFEKVDLSEMAERYGRLRSILMYREMMVVPGEVLLRKDLGLRPR